ncbi:MAG: TlpA family protein disulfide reductase [Magnetococcales bacterium]|nr:TlpA family protein disulfide reductase [Magnetococcales bacterium]
MIRRILAIVGMVMLFGSAWAGEGGLDAPLEGMDGRPVRLTDFKGKVVLVNFWATWCPPCLDEIPALIKLQKKYGEKGFLVVGIDYLERADKEELKKFLDAQGINYPVVIGDPRAVQSLTKVLGGVYALPVTKLLNREGKLAGSHIGSMNYSQMESLVEPLL